MPAKADPATWQAAGAALAAALTDLKAAACSSPRGADEKIAGAVAGAHAAQVRLLLAIPPR
jgi:hypothetical protein